MSKPLHFTYSSCKPNDDLQQGDILQPTDGICSILENVHKHFANPSKYTAFLVLTQTCDLVRRKEEAPCKSRYINLAVVRPLKHVLYSLLDKVCKVKVAEGVYLKNDKSPTKHFLERMVNQNEQAMGLFYLYPDAGINVAEHSVAQLQVSIAVRTKEHYGTLVDARTGRLKPEFQSKLGWLAGNLYSRVATQDWPEKDRDSLIEDFLSLGDGQNKVKWIPEKEYRKMSEAVSGDEIKMLPRVDIDNMLDQYKSKTPKDIAIERTISVIRGAMDDDISAEQLAIIKGRLYNDLLFGEAFK